MVKISNKVKKSILSLGKESLRLFIDAYESKKGGDPALPFMKQTYNRKYGKKY